MDAIQESLYPSHHFPYAAVAQWIEYWPPKPRVAGSIPASRTIFSFPLQSILCSIGNANENVEVYPCNTSFIFDNKFRRTIDAYPELVFQKMLVLSGQTDEFLYLCLTLEIDHKQVSI